MPSKKKYNARFPPARIKKIMQTDEEVGKVAAPVPVIISRVLELFVKNILTGANSLALNNQARTLQPQHLAQAVTSSPRLHFLQETVQQICSKSGQEGEVTSSEDPSAVIDYVKQQHDAAAAAASASPTQGSSSVGVSAIVEGDAVSDNSPSSTPNTVGSTTDHLAAAPAAPATENVPATTRGRGRGRPRGRPPKRPVPDLKPINFTVQQQYPPPTSSPVVPVKRGRGRPKKQPVIHSYMEVDQLNQTQEDNPLQPPSDSKPLRPQQPAAQFKITVGGSSLISQPETTTAISNPLLESPLQLSVLANSSSDADSSIGIHVPGNLAVSTSVSTPLGQNVSSSGSSSSSPVASIAHLQTLGNLQTHPVSVAHPQGATNGTTAMSSVTAAPTDGVAASLVGVTSASNPFLSGIKVEIPALPTVSSLPLVGTAIPPIGTITYSLPSPSVDTNNISETVKVSAVSGARATSKKASPAISESTIKRTNSSNGENNVTVAFGAPILSATNEVKGTGNADKIDSHVIQTSLGAGMLTFPIAASHITSNTMENSDEDYDA